MGLQQLIDIATSVGLHGGGGITGAHSFREDLLSLAMMLLSVALIGVILLQVRGEGLGGLRGGSFVRTRRGLEKTLFQFTIVLVAIFLFVSALSVVAGR
jgi:preprotein translocase subunit SecG